jgi:integrase/recombinase XerD
MDAAWSTCLAFFLDSVEAISGSVASRRRYHDVTHAFFNDPARNPDSYSSTEVLTFLTRKSRSRRNPGATVTAGTRNNRLMVLSSFYKFASTYEVNGVPLLQSKPPTYGIKYAKFTPSPRALSTDELERFFAVIPKHTMKGIRDRAIFLTFFWSGRRRSEIARLRWRDIEQAIVVEPGGTRRPGVLYRYIAKGKSRERQLAEMPPYAWAAIMHYLRESGRLAIMTPDSPLFASVRAHQHEQQLTSDYLNDQFKSYAAKAGLDSMYSLHSLRHTAARERYAAGSSIQDVQVFLGHSSISTTDLYLKRLSGVADTGATLLEARFGKL